MDGFFERIIMHKFLGHDSWFDTLYRAKSSTRYPSMKAAMNLMLQRGGKTIVETGCVRLAHDYGAGYSTVMFSDFLNEEVPDGHLYTVDISETNTRVCKNLTAEWQHCCTVTCMDSVEYLENHWSGQAIDMLYLDSWDYPIVQLWEIYGGSDSEAARIAVARMTREDLIEAHGTMISDPQEHCLKEFKTAEPYLHADSVVLIDDNDFPGGGKSCLTKDYLAEQNWICIMDGQQSLWIKGS